MIQYAMYTWVLRSHSIRRLYTDHAALYQSIYCTIIDTVYNLHSIVEETLMLGVLKWPSRCIALGPRHLRSGACSCGT